MTISLIAAMGRNRVIGNENKLIWNVPEDMKRFRELTKGKPIIMGRKTFESIGKPLPNRINIIITRDLEFKATGCVVVHSPKEALSSAKDANETMIIGGAKVYEQFLPMADKIYLTVIDEDFQGDAHFPHFSKNDWMEVKKESLSNGKYNFDFVDYERKQK